MLEKTILFVIGLTLVASRRDPFYRNDYTYVDQFDAFYKVHWDENEHSWDQAILTCDDEESTLFYPKMKDEWVVVKALVAAMKEKPNVTDIIVGIYDESGTGKFRTVNGLEIPSPVVIEEQISFLGKKTYVTMDKDTGSYKLGSYETKSVKPFVCKKKVVTEACPTVDSGYTYVKAVKKCYKVNQRKKTWDNALKTCVTEGGVLAVITNDVEAEVIRRKLSYSQDYFVGVRRLLPDSDFYTVKGQKFDEVCYSFNWATNENDNATHNCGAVYDAGYEHFLYTKTKNCYDVSSFVCEMTPKP